MKSLHYCTFNLCPLEVQIIVLPHSLLGFWNYFHCPLSITILTVCPLCYVRPLTNFHIPFDFTTFDFDVSCFQLGNNGQIANAPHPHLLGASRFALHLVDQLDSSILLAMYYFPLANNCQITNWRFSAHNLQQPGGKYGVHLIDSHIFLPHAFNKCPLMYFRITWWNLLLEVNITSCLFLV